MLCSLHDDVGAAPWGVPGLQNVPRGCSIRLLPKEERAPQGAHSQGPRGVAGLGRASASFSINLFISDLEEAKLTS